MNDRDHTLCDLARLGLPSFYIDRVLRELPTIQRAHEAACMAWPKEMIAAFEKRGHDAFGRVKTALMPIAKIDRVRRQRDPHGCTVAVYAPGANMDSASPILSLCGHGFTASEMRRLDKAAEYRQKVSAT